MDDGDAPVVPQSPEDDDEVRGVSVDSMGVMALARASWNGVVSRTEWPWLRQASVDQGCVDLVHNKSQENSHGCART